MPTTRSQRVRAGVLGDLQYNDDNQSWLIELGQLLGIYELATYRYAETRPGLTQHIAEAASSIDQILNSHGVPISVQALSTIAPQSIDKTIIVLNAVKSVGGSRYAALVLISQCACFLCQVPPGSIPEEWETFVNFAKGRLGDIRNVAPDLSLATDFIWEALSSQAKKGLGTPGLLSLLRELSRPLVILVISADPSDATRLRIGEERRELDQALRATRFRDSFTIRDSPSCRIRDITRALDDHSPDILIFAGHGSSNGLCFEDNYGQAAMVENSRLASLLTGQDGLSLVVLSACYSQDQAQCIADAVGHAIGMEGEIMDIDAIDFTREFFTALGHGRTFKDSFSRAEAAVGLRSSSTLKAHFLESHHTGL